MGIGLSLRCVSFWHLLKLKVCIWNAQGWIKLTDETTTCPFKSKKNPSMNNYNGRWMHKLSEERCRDAGEIIFFAFVQHQMSDDWNLDISGSNSVQFLLNSIGNFDTTLQIGCETKSLG